MLYNIMRHVNLVFIAGTTILVTCRVVKFLKLIWSSDNGLSPGRRQAIIWTNAGILLIGSLGTNFSEISIGIQTFSLRKMHLKMSSAKWRPFCLGLNVLTHWPLGAAGVNLRRTLDSILKKKTGIILVWPTVSYHWNENVVILTKF